MEMAAYVFPDDWLHYKTIRDWCANELSDAQLLELYTKHSVNGKPEPLSLNAREEVLGYLLERFDRLVSEDQKRFEEEQHVKYHNGNPIRINTAGAGAIRILFTNRLKIFWRETPSWWVDFRFFPKRCIITAWRFTVSMIFSTK